MKKNLCALLALALLLPVLTGCASGQSTPQETTPGNTGAGVQTGEGAVTASGTVGTLTKEDAEKLALDHAGFTADQVTRLYTERDLDDRTPHYDVEFRQGGYEYDYEIHAQTGEILKSEKERD